MAASSSRKGQGDVFDRVAVEYDRRRPTYPERLVQTACKTAGLRHGDEVLEIGCGTGQLTRALLARGLRVTAVEPGARLAGLARRRTEGLGELKLLNARFEDAPLPRERFRAVFSASAIHWVDPDVGWQRAADALAPGGTLALIQYFGLDEPHRAEDRQALLEAMAAVAAEIAESWPRYRDLTTMRAGVWKRRENISDAWAWLGGYDVGRKYAAHLFDDALLAAAPTSMQHTAAELNAMLRTMSFWAQLSPERRAAMESANRTLYERLGRPIRSGVVACLVTAQRRPLR